MELVPTGFLPEFEDPDLPLLEEEPLSEEPVELDELDELDEEASPEPEPDLAGSDLAVESALSPDPLASDFEPAPSPSPLLLTAGTPPFRLSVR